VGNGDCLSDAGEGNTFTAYSNAPFLNILVDGAVVVMAEASSSPPPLLARLLATFTLAPVVMPWPCQLSMLPVPFYRYVTFAAPVENNLTVVGVDNYNRVSC
jgi:hypothetical protein